MRNELQLFAQRMEFVLQENDDKKPLSDCTQNYLEHKLRQHENKLQLAVCGNKHGVVMQEATHVAIYCMALSDNAKRLQTRAQTDE